MIRYLFLLMALCLPFSAQANEVSFSTWLAQMQQEAIGRGVRPETVYHALGNLYVDEGILDLDRKQPENTITAEKYWERVVNEARIQRGISFMRANREILVRVSETYGVQSRFIVALLGVESNYGETQGKTSIISALATLAYDGRRSEFFKEELMNALRIIDQGHIAPEDMVGSWAGAMGYCQFMPSSFFKYAQDFDADGKIDIWNSIPDAVASAANYLRQNGWRSDQTWGRRVRLTTPIPDSYVGRELARPLSEWRKMGVKQDNGKSLPNINIQASLIMPDGQGGSAFLVYNNFNVLMRWNRSTYFATSVGMIADRFGK